MEWRRPNRRAGSFDKRSLKEEYAHRLTHGGMRIIAQRSHEAGIGEGQRLSPKGSKDLPRVATIHIAIRKPFCSSLGYGVSHVPRHSSRVSFSARLAIVRAPIPRKRKFTRRVDHSVMILCAAPISASLSNIEVRDGPPISRQRHGSPYLERRLR